MSSKRIVGMLGATSVVMGATIVYLVMARAPMTAAERARLAKHDSRCQYVRLALDTDAQDLVEPARREEAKRRFYGPAAGHSYEEIMTCSEQPVDLSRHDACFLSSDYGCLADLARRARDSIPSRE